MLLYSYKI